MTGPQEDSKLPPPRRGGVRESAIPRDTRPVVLPSARSSKCAGDWRRRGSELPPPRRGGIGEPRTPPTRPATILQIVWPCHHCQLGRLWLPGRPLATRRADRSSELEVFAYTVRDWQQPLSCMIMHALVRFAWRTAGAAAAASILLRASCKQCISGALVGLYASKRYASTRCTNSLHVCSFQCATAIAIASVCQKAVLFIHSAPMAKPLSRMQSSFHAFAWCCSWLFCRRLPCLSAECQRAVHQWRTGCRSFRHALHQQSACAASSW